MHFLSAKKSWRILLMFAIVAVGFSYLVTMISVSTHGYAIRDLESKIEQLKVDNKKLNLEMANKQSITRVEQWVAESGMVAATDVQYVSATTGAVAAAR